MLDWAALDALGDVTIVELVARDGDDFSRWYFPWYIDSSGKSVSYADADAQPISVGAASTISGTRRVEIERHAQRLRAGGEPVQLLLPALEVGDGRRVVLDGSHRLAAVVGHGIPFRVLALSLDVGQDQRVLPDLVAFGRLP
jgi:hypothetical protein